MAGSHVPAVVDAAVDALRLDSTLAGQLTAAKIYTHVPQGTDPPYAWVLGGEELPWAMAFGDDAGFRQVDLMVTVVSTYRGTVEVDELGSLVLDVLLEDAAWSNLVGYAQVEFVRNTALPPTDLLTDGVMWFLRTIVVRVFVS